MAFDLIIKIHLFSFNFTEDADSPVIRGFSDDEPLLVA